jgi:hypothetical protein
MLMASSALSHPAAPGRAMTTISRAGRRGLCLRKDSLTRRLIRLRSTADLETFRDTASPSRADGPGPSAATTIRKESPQRRPDLNTRPNSAGDSKRCARVKPCGEAELAGSFLTAVSAERTSDGEAGTPLGAPAGQHQPTALGGHAGTETVGPFPLDVARLIGAFHRDDPVQQGWRQPDCPGPAKKTGNRTPGPLGCQHGLPDNRSVRFPEPLWITRGLRYRLRVLSGLLERRTQRGGRLASMSQQAAQ